MRISQIPIYIKENRIILLFSQNFPLDPDGIILHIQRMTALLKKVIERMKDLPEKEQDILASFILEHLGGKEGTAGMDDLHPEETHPWMLEEAHSEFESESTEDIGLS